MAFVFSVDVLDEGDYLGFITQATHEGTVTGFDLTDGAVIVRRIYADRVT